MTFAFAFVSRRVAFVAADRRLSGVRAANGHLATKLFSLETSDGQGIMTYAGAGARMVAGRKPFEISEWIERVLQGANRTLDQTLHEIAAAAEEQGLDGHAPGHTFGYAGFVDGKPRLHAITSRDQMQIRVKNGTSPLDTRGQKRFQVMNFDIGDRTKRFGLALGSGAQHFPSHEVMQMMTRQSDKARTKEVAADRLSAWFIHINREISAKEPATVGPEAICAWKYAGGGGAHAAYEATGQRSRDTGMLPNISRGFPLNQLLRPMWEQMQLRLKGWKAGDPPPIPSAEDLEELSKIGGSIDTTPKRKF